MYVDWKSNHGDCMSNLVPTKNPAGSVLVSTGSSGLVSSQQDERAASQSNVLTPPKKITKLSELISGVVIYQEFMGLQNEQKENLLVYAPHATQSKNKKDGTSVWVLTTDDYMQKNFHAFSELRKRLLAKDYVYHGVVKANKEIIKTLYENAESSEKAGVEDAEQTEGSNALKDFFTEMVSYALKESVSDIHIEKRSTRSIIRMRKHGQLIEYQEISNLAADRLCRVVYNVLAENRDIVFNEEFYQAAAVNHSVRGEEVKLRYQSLPVYPGGFDVILRVLPIGSDEEGVTPLENLGYSSYQVKTLLDISCRPLGALIIAGTTGSGKSTTLKNLLMYINHSRHYRSKIYTIEDPPEYKIPRVSQIPVVRREGDDPNISPFLAPLKATMRGDPDILMIGEIRDFFTGDGLKKATQSGHQVLTTVHATSALGIIERLADFGISASVMGSPEFINGLIYQKLVPILCQECAIPFKDVLVSSHATSEDTELSRRLEKVADLDIHDVKIRNAKGCTKCKGLGIVGRTVCSEIIAPDYNMLGLFREEKMLEAKHYWRSLSDRDPDSENMTGKTVLEHALLKMRRGIASPYDIEEVLGPVNGSVLTWEQMELESQKVTK